MGRDPLAVVYAAEAGACALSAWSGQADRCRWCDAAVAGDSVWCGHVCADEYARNHWWDHARPATLVRDGERCVRCGLGPASCATAKALLAFLIPRTRLDWARAWRSDELVHLLGALASASALEVNHIEPRRGGGYAHGCHHHQTNLETLCHRCHARVTAHQQHERRLAVVGSQAS
jgi:ferredoxin